MTLIDTIRRLFSHPAAETITHAPVTSGNHSAKKLAKARAEAAKRHGRGFRCDEVKARETPASRDLLELQQASKKPDSANVSAIKRRKA